MGVKFLQRKSKRKVWSNYDSLEKSGATRHWGGGGVKISEKNLFTNTKPTKGAWYLPVKNMDKYSKIFQLFVQEILNWLKLSRYFKFETVMLIWMAFFAQVSNMALVPLVFLYDKTTTKFQCLQCLYSCNMIQNS